jgi:hypothetical protein
MPEVDRSFLKDLKSLDKRLSVKWNDNVRNFIVQYERGYGEPVNIYRVRNEDGSFRQPDQRDMKHIKGGDLGEGDNMKARLKKYAYQSEKIREDQKRKSHDTIRDMTKDDRRYLSNRISRLTNTGKGVTGFRQVAPKKSKNTVRVIP